MSEQDKLADYLVRCEYDARDARQNESMCGYLQCVDRHIPALVALVRLLAMHLPDCPGDRNCTCIRCLIAKELPDE